MDKKTAGDKITHTPLNKITKDEVDKIKEGAIKAKLNPIEVHTHLVGNLMINEGWDFKKANNLVHLAQSLQDINHNNPSTFERVLKFPSEESIKELRHYLCMAGVTIKVGMYTFTNRSLINALKDAKSRGVIVKVITDKESLSTLYIHEMAAVGIECTHHNLSNHAKMHHKFCIIDDFIIINGSLNWTAKGVSQNHENVMVSGSKIYIKEFSKEFDQLWK